MRIIGRKKLDRPIMLAKGDRLTLNYVEVDGVIRTERSTIFAAIIPWRPITVDQVVMVETELDGSYAVGGLLVEMEKPE